MRVSLALPSKGRLKEQALAALAEAEMPISQPRDGRRYKALFDGRDDVEVIFLPASEIITQLGRGTVSLGIACEDLLYEDCFDWKAKMEILTKLGFGNADVVVAVPDVWFDVENMADLCDIATDFHQRHARRLRIATKYSRLTRQFFSHKFGIQAYRVVESLGATEIAPAAGTSDVIVDITTTGATLRANHLKVLEDGVILRSQACLVTSRQERPDTEKKVIAEIAGKLNKTVNLADA
ncbi:ATP phosphoribosyltransferase [Ensifer aridi]|uniref:ATP phosphoribosyltransferase n=1 Tax=Ensifer aridi TaxID=1708715 RepID=UPI000A1209F1|nr:ATP phosphoribosyltransferase [Ensifer aridi]